MCLDCFLTIACLCVRSIRACSAAVCVASTDCSIQRTSRCVRVPVCHDRRPLCSSATIEPQQLQQRWWRHRRQRRGCGESACIRHEYTWVVNSCVRDRCGPPAHCTADADAPAAKAEADSNFTVDSSAQSMRHQQQRSRRWSARYTTGMDVSHYSTFPTMTPMISLNRVDSYIVPPHNING